MTKAEFSDISENVLYYDSDIASMPALTLRLAKRERCAATLAHVISEPANLAYKFANIGNNYRGI